MSGAEAPEGGLSATEADLTGEVCAGGALATSSPNSMGDMGLPIYHGPISRQRCEELLGRKGKDGSYLIRDSETIQGALCLCVYKQKIVYTYRILQTHTGYYTLQTCTGTQELYFKTLQELIRHYKKRNQGLSTRLRYSVKRKTMVPQADDSNDCHDYENVESSDYVVVLPD
ncbi:SH2 domain-containing protein 1B [Pygocentrus nattereri]|uniref:SH2 domain-containing protein n=1 Tax=Pygocentrus nattereri TaxID=42514 RepID=A0AAR2JB55_PYGNA|nr:SH2 domain-containing protein 1B [Pygocentrus nattereri]